MGSLSTFEAGRWGQLPLPNMLSAEKLSPDCCSPLCLAGIASSWQSNRVHIFLGNQSALRVSAQPVCLCLQSAKNAGKLGKNAAKGQDRDIAAREKALAKREREVEARERALEAAGGNLKVGRGVCLFLRLPIAGFVWGWHRQHPPTQCGWGPPLPCRAPATN